MEQHDPEILAKVTLLQKVPLLERIDSTRLRLLAGKMGYEAAGPNEVIVKQGDAGDKLYIITAGKVIVTKQVDYHHYPVAKLGPGDFFGEIAILRNIPRTATVTTETHCSFLTINKHCFLHQYEEFPARIRDDIQMIITKRLQETQNL